MKHFYTLLFLCFAFVANAQLNIPSPPSYIMCDSDGDEIATFDLTNYASVILGNLSPQEYTVSYYESLQSAQDQSFSIENPTQYNNTLAVQTLYARVTENLNQNNFTIVLVDLRVTAAPVINQPAPLTICDSDGLTTIDLTYYAEEIISGCNSCMITYYQTDDYNAPLINPESYMTSGNHTIYVKVTDVETLCEAFTTMTVSILLTPDTITLPAINPSTCIGGTYDLTLNNNLYDPLHVITFYATESDANMGINPILSPESYITTPNSVWVKISNGADCFTILEQRLTGVPITIVDVAINGQTATINATGMGPFIYSIISGPAGFPNPFPYQTSNIITDMPLGMYTIQVEDGCGQIMVITLMITNTDAPIGETSQTFTEGETLADLEVSGDNIQWYDAITGGNLLPITTLLTDGTTYYAERSAGRALRAMRLAVTVHLVLSTGSNTLQTLSYYPNPVKNALNIKNASPINSIAVYNALGQQVLNSTINATETNPDLSALSNGIYFVKVQAGESSKTVRIVNE